MFCASLWNLFVLYSDKCSTTKQKWWMHIKKNPSMESVIEMTRGIYCYWNILLPASMHGRGGLIRARPTTCQIKGYIIIPLALEKSPHSCRCCGSGTRPLNIQLVSQSLGQPWNRLISTRGFGESSGQPARFQRDSAFPPPLSSCLELEWELSVLGLLMDLNS